MSMDGFRFWKISCMAGSANTNWRRKIHTIRKILRKEGRKWAKIRKRRKKFY